jgi:hypothetical protein
LFMGGGGDLGGLVHQFTRLAGAAFPQHKQRKT